MGLTRREFLEGGFFATGTVAGLVLLGRNLTQPEATAARVNKEPLDATYELKRTPGRWSIEDVDLLKEKLYGENRLIDLQNAGDIIYQSYNGLNNFTGDFFVAEPQRPITVVNGPYRSGRSEMQFPYESTRVIRSGESQFTFQRKNSVRTTLTGQAAWELQGVIMREDMLQGKSDRAIEFTVAKALMKPTAVSEMMTYLERHSSDFIEYPNTGDAWKAFLIWRFNNEGIFSASKGASVLEVERMWESFLMLPSYLTAKDNDILTPEDLEVMKNYEKYSKHFVNKGILVKGNNGYEWVQDSSKKHESWAETAVKILNGVQLT